MKLLFDFGGVLVDLDRSRCVKAFAELGFDIFPYLGAYKQGGPFSEIERNAISIPEFCNEIRRLSGHPHTTDEAIIRAWESFLPGVPTKRLDMLLKIKQHYSVSVLSNTNFIHWRMACDDFFRYKGLSVDDFFDHIFLSCELGMEKPDKRVFHAVTEQLNVPAEEILFFDDAEANCEAARQCGMKALLAPAGSKWFEYFDDDGRLIATV